LIFETVATIPQRGGSQRFIDQATVLGTPKSKSKKRPR
jgi:hypothetical protein